MTFNYLYSLSSTESFDVSDIGNFTLSCTNNLGQEYFILVRTKYGITRILTWGPRWVDMETACNNVTVSFQEFQFSASKLETLVDRYVNDAKKSITQVTVLEDFDLLNMIPDIRGYIDVE